MISVDLMQLFTDYWLKPSLGLLVVLVIMQKATFRSAAINHRYLLCALAALAGLTIALPVLPHWSLHILPQSLAMASQLHIIVGENSGASIGLYGALTLYVLGFCWSAIYTLQCLRDARKLSNDGRPLNAQEQQAIAPVITRLNNLFELGKRQPSLRVSAVIQTPLMWKWRAPIIVLPETYTNWSAGCLLRVLAHEYAHIERGDWLAKIMTRVLCVIGWPIPLMWLTVKKLNWYAEVACDDRVIELLNCRGEYADDLLSLSTDQKHSAFALSYLRGSELYERINMVLDPCRRKNRPSLAHVVFAFLLFVIGFSPLAMTGVHSAAGENFWDDTQYLLPTHVPLLIVPEESPIANKENRVRWMLRQMELDYPAIPKATKAMPNEPKQTTETLAHTLRNEAQTQIESAPPVTQQRYPEEQMVISGNIRNAISEAELPPLNKNVNLPQVAIRGYIPTKIVTPKYPQAALKRNITGKVVVQFDVDENGWVVNSKVLRATPSKIFNRAVLKALEEFRFMPLSVNGEPVITKNVSETFIFTL